MPPQDTPFGSAIPLGRYGGVRVGAHWSVFVILALVTELLAQSILPDAAPGYSGAAYVGVALAAAVAFLATLLAHELAHAVVARHYGMPVQRITLWMLGGMTELGDEPPSPRADVVIAGAGPATSLALSGAFAGLAWVVGDGLLGSALAWLAVVNILLGGFNLLPGAPLDGGRLLRGALWRRYRDRARAAEASARVGQGLGIALVAVGMFEVLAGSVAGLWLALIGWFVMAGAAGERHAALVARTGDLTVRDVMTADPVVAPAWLTVADFVRQLTPERAGQPVYPVVDLDGQPDGVLTARDVGRVPAQQRDTTRVRDIRRPRPLVVAPDSGLAELVGPIQLHGGAAVVVDSGRIVGLVTVVDLERAATLASLGWRRPSSDQSPT